MKNIGGEHIQQDGVPSLSIVGFDSLPGAHMIAPKVQQPTSGAVTKNTMGDKKQKARQCFHFDNGQTDTSRWGQLEPRVNALQMHLCSCGTNTLYTRIFAVAVGILHNRSSSTREEEEEEEEA